MQVVEHLISTMKLEVVNPCIFNLRILQAVTLGFDRILEAQNLSIFNVRILGAVNFSIFNARVLGSCEFVHFQYMRAMMTKLHKFEN